MGIQYNFFACGSDIELIAEAIGKVYSQPAAMPKWFRGSEYVVTRLLTTEDFVLLNSKIGWSLFEFENSSKLEIGYLDGNTSVHTWNSPVIEYSPAYLVSEDIVRIGRFYTNSNDATQYKVLNKIKKILDLVATKLQNSPGAFRALPEARKAKWFRPWGGQDTLNPFWSQSPEGLSSHSHD